MILYTSFLICIGRQKSFDPPTLPAGKEWHAAIETFDETFHVLPQTAVTDQEKQEYKTGQARQP